MPSHCVPGMHPPPPGTVHADGRAPHTPQDETLMDITYSVVVPAEKFREGWLSVLRYLLDLRQQAAPPGSRV